MIWLKRGIFASMMISGLCVATHVVAQSNNVSPDKMALLMYTRIILDANGNIRIDENLVPNIRLSKWFKLELGIRQGERPQRFDSYYHYKV